MTSLKKRRPSWFVYMIECEGNRIYTGVAVDVDARYKKHCSGRGAAFTRINKPLRLLAAKKCKSRSDALKQEYALKQLTRDQKIAWISSVPPYPIAAIRVRKSWNVTNKSRACPKQ